MIFYSIVEETDTAYLTLVEDKVIVPAALMKPEQLKFIRNTFLDIIDEFNINLACVRVTESSSQSANEFRIGVEAVIQELYASSSIKKYYAGQISSISAKLGIKRDQFKPLVAGTETYNDYEGWGKMKPEARESLLSAFSALNLL